MGWLRGGLSLKVKITAAFVLIVVGGTAVSTLIGSRIITNALLNQARSRVYYGLEATRMVYAERQSAIWTAVTRFATAETMTGAVRGGDRERLRQELAAAQREAGLSFLGFVDARTGQATRGTPAADSAPPEPKDLGALIAAALHGQHVSGTEVLSHETLLRESAALAEQARLPLVPTLNAAPDSRREVSSGLTLVAAVPVSSEGQVVGALYGGVLLNRNFALIEKVKNLVYGGEQYRGREIGTITIFMSDVRVSTNVATSSGDRALGTRASAEVARAVLREGRSWYGRAFVVQDWYIAAYEPIRNHGGSVIGMLYAGMPEAPFLAVRTDVMLTFLVVTAFGILVVLGLTYLITRSMTRPLEEMVAATKRIAEGDLHHTVTVRSRDEIGYLAVSFNQMLGSLQQMKLELENWGRTLEEKVRERTEELVTVQARMAQSEKLASIGRLAAGVAHEINNPLGGILSLAMLQLEDCDRQHPMREDLETIVKQTLRCREIVKGLLDFSRQSEARAAVTEVRPIIENTLSLLERQAIFHNVRTVRKFADVPQVFIDPGQMQEVVMNIVLNAVDAMEENGELGVEVSGDDAASEVLIRISDTGKGIPEDVMPFIFEPFFTTKRVGQGTGLGLAIVHGIVTRAGGRIEVTSSPGRTCFTVRLPVAAAGLDDAAAVSAGLAE